MNDAQEKSAMMSATVEAKHINADFDIRDVNNAAWRRATPVLISRYWSSVEAPQARHAEARLLWSNDALYVRFVANQNEPLVISDKPQLQKKTIGLWDRDVCEIFVAPDVDDPTRYGEFEIAPTGEWVDLKIHQLPDKRETDFNFDSGMTAAAKVEPGKITLAIRIPFQKAFNKTPRAGDLWRANLFRCVGKDEPTRVRGYLAWQPTETAQPAFHVPQKFGWLRFAE